MSNEILVKLSEASTEVEKSWIITEPLLRNLPHDVQQAIFATAVPHWFNSEVVSALLKVSLQSAKVIYQELRSLHFVQPFGESKHTYHDLTREAILRYAVLDTDKKIFARRAYNFFNSFEEEDYQIEALYHFLQVDESAALEKVKEKLNQYRNNNLFNLAHSLLRIAKELIYLNMLEHNTELEIERQEFLMGWRRLKASENERHPDLVKEHLTKAIQIFKSSENVNNLIDWQPERLRQTAQQYQFEILEQKLKDTEEDNDIQGQQIWLLELADLHNEEQNYDKALKYINKSVSLDENNYRAWGIRGLIHRSMKNYQAALADFSEAIRLKPKDELAFIHRGIISPD